MTEIKGTKSNIGEDGPTDSSKAVLDDLVNDSISSLPEEKQDVKQDVKREESTESEGLGNESNEEESENQTETKSEESEDEELIPASKVKKIKDKMSKRIDELSRKLAEKESAEPKKTDTQEDKLSRLSISDLETLRENADESIMDLKVAAKVDGEDVTEKLTELRELKRNIDSTIKNAPKRFQQRQIENLDAMIDEVKEVDPDIVNKRGKLWETANVIYNKMPSLSRTETGMAEAVAMATEHFLSNTKLSSGVEKVKTLNQTVTKLKQKTSLDTKNKSVDASGESFKKLRAKAVNGSQDDKLAFVSTLIPDDFLQH